MARIRFAHNSFSTGLVSKKVQGNTEFEGYNNALDECTNFQVMHTGGVIKRGGTVFVANTKYNKPVKLFPFIYSALESYMCEFGDLEVIDRHKGTANTNLSDDAAAVYGYPKGLRYNADGYIVDASGRLMELGYIRFYTARGVTRISDLYVPFTLEDLKTGNILQEGNLINVVTKIGLYRIIRENNFKFRITVKDDYVNSPKTFSVNAPVYLKPTSANDPNGNYQIIVQNAPSDEDPIEEKYYGAIKQSDKGSYLYLKYMLDNGLAFYCLTINSIDFTGSRPHKIKATIYPKFCVNCLKKEEGSEKVGNFKFPTGDGKDGSNASATLNWSVSAFTEERGYPEAAALYERRLFLASNKEYPTGIWGSSMQFDNTMDFTPDNTSLSALQVKMGSQYTDKILWMIGQNKLFIGTNGGIFMAGAPDDKAQMSTANISVRMFDAVSASPLPPVIGGESVFFVDSSEKNVHEIILSSETGTYKANDVSLLANELTTSGIVSHCWTQHPIKTYWCATKAGYLCALTYLKNNGILAWSKHELAGGHSAKVECVSSMKHNGEDHLWLCVNRNKASGEDNRQIEYMSHSYNSRDVEDCQHYLDSGMFKTDETAIVKIDTSAHTQIKGDFRFAAAIITRRRNCSVIFEHSAANSILNKNLSFFIQTPSETGACILRDFTYEHEHVDIDGNQLSPKDRGMIDPSIFGAVTDASSKREYYYEVASIEDFSLKNEVLTILKLDTVEFLTVGDKVVIFAWENAGLESISTKRDPEASRIHHIFSVNAINHAMNTVSINFPKFSLAGSLVSGKLYKLSNSEMEGYILGRETAVICQRQLTLDEKVQFDSIPNMEDICNKDCTVKSCSPIEDGKFVFTFQGHWFVNGVPQPLDTCDKTGYEAAGGNDARMLHYFDYVTGLDHFECEEVTVISNGTTFKSIVTNGTVQAGKNGEATLFCSVGLPFTASLKTVPLSGGNVTGSSVGCVGSQRSMVLHLFESWGGTYGTSEGERRPIPYPKTAEAIFNESEGLFTGTVKCPVINGDPTNRCIYIHHNEPTAFSLISMVQDVQVSDA